MARRSYSIGDKVLVSRDDSGENHEHGVVIDSYELLIGEERRPTIVVEFEDGERKYMTAATPNVLPVEPEEEEAAEDDPGVGAKDAQAGTEELVEAEPSGNGAVSFDDDELGSP